MSKPEPIKSGWDVIFGVAKIASGAAKAEEEAKDRASRAKTSSDKVSYDEDYSDEQQDPLRRYPKRRPDNHA